MQRREEVIYASFLEAAQRLLQVRSMRVWSSEGAHGPLDEVPSILPGPRCEAQTQYLNRPSARGLRPFPSRLAC